MTSDEYRTILNAMTEEQLARLAGMFAWSERSVDQLVKIFEENPSHYPLEERLVTYLKRNVRGCEIETEAARVSRATIDAAWYAWAAFWSATVIGLAGLAATIYFGLRP